MMEEKSMKVSSLHTFVSSEMHVFLSQDLFVQWAVADTLYVEENPYGKYMQTLVANANLGSLAA